MYWLSDMATPQIGEAWSNVMAFSLLHMLEAFLFQRTDPYAFYQNINNAAARQICMAIQDDEKNSSINENNE